MTAGRQQSQSWVAARLGIVRILLEVKIFGVWQERCTASAVKKERAVSAHRKPSNTDHMEPI